MRTIVGKDICRDLDQAMVREWLDTNGCGGFASSTIAGPNTRRYHGLLIAALDPPVGRVVYLSSIQETVTVGSQSLELGCNVYHDVVHPRDYRYLEHVQLDPYPIFTYRIEGVSLEKHVMMLSGRNATVVSYRSTEPLDLILRPLLSLRDFHHLSQYNGVIDGTPTIAGQRTSFTPYDGLPSIHFDLSEASYQPDAFWYYNFSYPVEAYRGLDSIEDLFAPGEWHCHVTPDLPLTVVASVDDAVPTSEAFALAQNEERRRTETLKRMADAVEDGFERALTRAADAFVVRRKSGLSTILAGYPWFSDWGRDTMIALPGLTLVTGRHQEAKEILTTFAQVCDQGMIPNRFPDHGTSPDYNSVDASLWFVHAVDRYLAYTGDTQGVQSDIWPVIKDIVEAYRDGTRYGIRMEEDGLVTAGQEGVQLTWMDAKVGDWVVTPRSGKAVEINALWYNAVAVAQKLARAFGDASFEEMCAHTKKKTAASFEAAFWNTDTNCLYDVLDGENKDGSVRPNQIFALSLPNRMLPREREQSILQVVHDELVTPYGLRSLSRRDPAYAGHYGGDPHERDGAYHQGTVWGWLIGPFVTSWVRLNGGPTKAREQARSFLSRFEQHLHEAGLCNISEIFDGNPPHTSRGCFAQAWSVAEVLRAYVEDVIGRRP